MVIAGAGPAGIATAVALGQRQPRLAGRIVVLDRARFPRSKPCGGGLTGHARAADEAPAGDAKKEKKAKKSKKADGAEGEKKADDKK